MTTAPYRPFPNQFRTDVRAEKRLIGCWASLASPITTEILGLAGFDWILLDAEHSPNDVLSLVPQLMALKDSASAPVVRPPWNEPVIIKRLLDIGFHNFLVPYVESVEEAERAVASPRLWTAVRPGAGVPPGWAGLGRSPIRLTRPEAGRRGPAAPPPDWPGRAA